MIASALVALLGALVYGAIAIAIGALAVRWLLLPRCELTVTERSPAERLVATGGMLAVVAIIFAVPARVLLQLQSLLEPGEPWQPALKAILFDTASGKATQVQLVWATATLLAFAVARSGRLRGWRVATIATLVLSLTPALGGHAAAAERPIVAMTMATFHVLAAGAWVGTLFHLWRVAREGSERTLRGLIAAFHRVAIGAVAVLVLSGAYATITMLPSPGALVRTGWGVLLLAKLCAVAAVAALGAWHWRTAETHRGDEGRAALTRSLGIETLLAVGVLLLTGFLTASAPPE